MEKSTENPSPKGPETWDEYVKRRAIEDPHGISEEDREVNDATRGYWDAFWRWPDGSSVGGMFYSNYGAAKKAARKYGFLLPEANVKNHERLKELLDKGERPFSHAASWRSPAPRDTVSTTIMKVTKSDV